MNYPYPIKPWLLQLGAPENFDMLGGRRTFVKIHYARHQITLSDTEPARVSSEVRFTNSEEGTPIIDFYNDPYADARVSLNSSMADLGFQTVQAPDGSPYEYRVIAANVPADVVQTAWIDYQTTTLSFAPEVPLFFRMSDLDDATFTSPQSTPFRARCFLDRYVPANLEFDQHPVDVAVTFDSGGSARLENCAILSNGRVRRQTGSSAVISFPATFSVSCPFLAIVHKDCVVERRFEFARNLSDPNPIRVTVFNTKSKGGQLEDHAEQASTALRELDDKFGAFPYDKLLLYSSDGGAMEYAGAAEVSGSHVAHEILHSYFGRGLMPANGDAGWFDEAVASWVENGCARETAPPDAGSDCANRGRHHRRTSPDASRRGKVFISHLAHLVDMSAPFMGGVPRTLEGALRKMSRIAGGRTLRAKEIEELFAALTNLDCRALFQKYVYHDSQPT